MIIVVDTNIAIAAILKRSTTQEILFNPELEPYAPEFIGEEIIKHRQELMKRAGILKTSFIRFFRLYSRELPLCAKRSMQCTKNMS